MGLFATAGGAGPGLEYCCEYFAGFSSLVVGFLALRGAVKRSLWTVLPAVLCATVTETLALLACFSFETSTDPDEVHVEALTWRILIWSSLGSVAAVGSLLWLLLKGKREPPTGPPNPFADTSSPEGATGNSQG